MFRQYRTELSLLIAVIAVLGLTILFDGTRAYQIHTHQNVTELLLQTSLLGIVAIGVAVVIMSGGIDLSAGSVIAFSGMVCASIIYCLVPLDARGSPKMDHVAGWILTVAVCGTLVSAFLVGSLHAWLITVIRLPPFVATLASLVGLRSLARVLIKDVTRAVTHQPEGNSQINLRDEFFHRWGTEWQIPFVLFLLLAAATWLLLSRTITGRHLYAMGGNEAAARLSGIRTEKLKWLAYCYSSMTAALVGILLASYANVANPATIAMGYELNGIAAAVVGGCSLQGGVGTVPGILLGALFLRAVIDSVAKTFKTQPDEFQGLIVGVLVVLAVTLNEFRGKAGATRRFLPGGLGIVTWLNLTLLSGVLAVVIVSGHKLMTGTITTVVVGVLLGSLAVWERRKN